MKKILAASRTNNIRYAVRDIVVLAEEVKKTGKQMLYLNIGDPNIYDFQTPMHLIEPVYKAMKDNRNGYSASSGIQEARDAIGREAERNGIRSIRDIFVTTGASEAIELCLTALVNPGEEVLLPNPGYPLYDAVMSKLGAKPNPYYLDEENGWQPDLEDIRRRVNANTKAIVIINPNNPTGSVCSEATLRGLLDIAREHNLLVFADEIYDKLILDDEQKHISIASLDPEAPVITFNGLAKGFIAPGFRIGWGIASGPAAVLSDFLEGVNKMLRARLCANHPMQFAIKPALEGDFSYLKEARTRLRRRRDLTVEMLNKTDAISCVAPAGAFYAYPQLHIDMPDDEFVKGVLRETGVVVVPGSGFGQKPGTRHFRVVFLPPEETLRQAYQHINDFAMQRA